MKNSFIIGALLCLSAMPFIVYSDEGDYQLVIKDHHFAPAELKVPAGKRIKLIVANQDETVEEFESKALRVEKIIPGNTNATIWVGPLEKGKYTFVGEFHEDTAKGVLISE